MEIWTGGVTKKRLDAQDSIPGRGTDFSLRHYVHNGAGDLPAVISVYRQFFLDVTSAGA
jgi:hypothetical protein